MVILRRHGLLFAPLVLAVAGCGGGGEHSGVPPANLQKVKVTQADKIKAIEQTKKAAAAAGPKNIVGRQTGCGQGSFPTWSPDGRQIAWAGRPAVCIADADGSHVRPLPHTHGIVDSPFDLVWVKPRLLLYGDDYTISLLPIRGKPHLLRGVEAPNFAVSRDGSRFSTATQSDCPGCTGQAHVWTLAGKPVGAIGNSKVYYDAPSLSQDGSEIAYAQNGGIWTASADGSHARERVSSGTAPLWSPAGDTIAYATSAGLWTVGANGGMSRLVARGVSDNGGWSPDGKLIASWGLGGLDVVDVASGKVRKLPFVGYPNVYPPSGSQAWSPDSNELLVTARLSGRCSALWREPVDGSKPRLLSSCY